MTTQVIEAGRPAVGREASRRPGVTGAGLRDAIRLALAMTALVAAVCLAGAFAASMGPSGMPQAGPAPGLGL